MNENITYYGLFTATINSEERVIASIWKEFIDDSFQSGNFGIFMTVIFIMIMAFLSAFHILALILATFGLVFAKTLGLITLGWPIITTVVIASFIIGLIVSVMKR